MFVETFRHHQTSQMRITFSNHRFVVCYDYIFLQNRNGKHNKNCFIENHITQYKYKRRKTDRQYNKVVCIFGHFAGDAVLCSMFFRYFLLSYSFIKMELLHHQTCTKLNLEMCVSFSKSTEDSILPKMLVATLLHSHNKMTWESMCVCVIFLFCFECN